ncbi:MAG: DsbA family protein [Salipiger thiooxidans]|uniref:2-hydroxychromene-2-carboxylate isomerase n=1 Tax=Salipiger thiooxidans TaxID=282683 RepID=UPI001A8D7410|nr:2-hydroxychromene-2-carboxylate isomerase [Salipiger thiooxidans]MBN8186024.1 2-hydroxychromene-2-carboxylate isomerase [Salipiger thiooxidans]MCA0849738.1 2-hydroxychromene-2-carboxylate isomerase [Salipiger thiooxidans]
MSKVIDYYFGPISGYAYLGHAALMALARETGARVRFLPIDMLKVYEASGLRPPYDQSEAARSYRVEDQRRLARMRGLRMKVGPENYPADTRLACRVILAAGRLGLDQDSIAMACLRGTWAEGRNIADPGDLGEALRQIDMPCMDLLHTAETEELRDEADAVTQAAIDAGVFGSPTYVIDGERFWGQDRLDFMREALRKVAA